MPRRSVMFTPGDRPEMMRKAPGAGADVIVFDLEDAVAPERKAEARTAIRDVLTDPEFDPDCEVCVRVNPTGIAADDDLRGIADGAETVDSVMLPKTGSADDAETLARLLDEHDYRVPILALVETASGVLNAAEIAAVDETDALVFGAEDLSADIGATRTEEGTEVLYAREHVVLAASAEDVDAIDTVYTDIDDTDGLGEETEFAIRLGYDGKMAIHPAQVTPINEAFTPDPERVEWAEAVLEAKATADEEGRGVFRVDGEMIDAPLIAQAERIMEYAQADS
ncbi:Citrate (pro-3S)-lyase [Haladaptatus paucihalophilus DX253]|uniref:Citrate (Pro-3S)-lyase n=1 Tax=Haladaptatus paucihalophilus DX253 TaxID=797209 RepID=E7QYN9_HALPU|nr:CoA ester lyase [Haladaptatus paucihalophilus]EFW90305.1 Citrate (pro-3S)-lyase [Haladaptatus paucihalophilus DX253]SHK00670.1 citrate lyase subunit beta / citryl-CoA lyase [Haladaptatus paucihalophilus DX253]